MLDSFNLDISPLKKRFDSIESDMAKMPQVYLPLVHRFTPGLYIREIFMPAGTLVSTRTHKTTHPYIIKQGKYQVIDQEGKGDVVEAPFTGITQSGTRRVINIIEDTIWISFHITDKTNLDEINDDLSYTENEGLPKEFIPACYGKPRDVLMP